MGRDRARRPSRRRPGPERLPRAGERATCRRRAQGTRGHQQPGQRAAPGCAPVLARPPIPAQPGGARPARPGRPAATADSASWEALSDVDYWAELAADKPLTPSPGADAAAVRRGSDQKADARAIANGGPPRAPGRPRRPCSAARPSAAAIAPGAVSAADEAADGAPTQQPNTRAGSGRAAASLARARPQPRASQRWHGLAVQPPLARASAVGQRPGSGPRPDDRPVPGRAAPACGTARPGHPPAPAAAIRSPARHNRPPLPMDDDPLTSPSFPAINTSDSRSYRPRRSGGSQTGPSVIRQRLLRRHGSARC